LPRVRKLSKLNQEERKKILERATVNIDTVRDSTLKIIQNVREKGNKALIEYTRKFDGVELAASEIRISEGEIKDAYSEIPSSLLKALKHATGNIERFHRSQLTPQDQEIEIEQGIVLTRLRRPIERIGAYIPGGAYAYPSTALMTIIPARISGVSQIAVCSPPRYKGTIPPSILVSCDLAGATEIYKIGGAQAIAAMAYGTESIPKVDKIFGPGNIYVTAAKLLIFPDVDIEMPAGPSEVLVLADETANPKLIAADMISQAEHGPEGASTAILVTTSASLVGRVQIELSRMVTEAPNKREIETSLENCGVLLLTKDMEEALDFINEYAPEHLELMVSKPFKILDRVFNAGTIFLGDYSPVAAGDYATGANHVLPTGGYARTRSGLSVEDFTKRITIQHLSKKGLKNLRETIVTLADAEGLDAHGEAVNIRFQKKSRNDYREKEKNVE